MNISLYNVIQVIICYLSYYMLFKLCFSMEECEALCTRLAIMVNGQLKCIGSLQVPIITTIIIITLQVPIITTIIIITLQVPTITTIIIITLQVPTSTTIIIITLQVPIITTITNYTPLPLIALQW